MDLGSWLSAFGLVFIAELGDKTQLAMVSQMCKFRTP
ncbi:MAG: TMEM165/GDT1 family protein [Anaerolineae bacterium]